MIALLDIRTYGIDIPVGSLSGGNQQKVVIAKWLMNRPRIILLNDPPAPPTKSPVLDQLASGPVMARKLRIPPGFAH